MYIRKVEQESTSISFQFRISKNATSSLGNIFKTTLYCMYSIFINEFHSGGATEGHGGGARLPKIWLSPPCGGLRFSPNVIIVIVRNATT